MADVPATVTDATTAAVTAVGAAATATAARMGPWEGCVHLAAIIASVVLGVLALRCTPPATTLAEYSLAAVVLLGGIRVADVLSWRASGRGLGPAGPLAVLTLAALTALLGG